MKYVDYERPTNLKAALEILQNNGETTKILAGGTDILTKLRIRREQPDLLLDSKEIPELNELSYNPDSGLTVGGAVPFYKLYAHADVIKYYQSIVDSTKIIGGIPIQGRATLGGNLCNAAPSADAIPTLIVLGATATIHSLNDSREVPISEFCTGPGSTILNTNEIVVSINIPSPKQNSGAHYMRFIPRNEMDIAVVGVGTSVELSDDGSKFKDAQVSLASVAPTPLHVTSITDYLSGKEINDENIEKAGELAKDATKPISDMRGTAEYRQHLCTVLTKRSLKQSIERAKEN
jgi:carbon-monoxide dehydrogenase medium subunit|tara:strand:- start:4768 stop:5643 length:876 start_codon:yes stop_codon:yes gene_type:complete